ncbi:MAG: putative glycoside hydrolase [Spirochaetia bacterium]|jgi:hypothetical protein
MSKRLILIVSLSMIFLSSAGIVGFLSAQDGVGPTVPSKTEAKNVPLETRYAPDRIYRAGPGIAWRVSRDLGVLLSTDDGETWTARNQGLPARAVYPFTAEKPPIITCLAVDPYNRNRLGVSTLDTLFLSEDAGLNWEPVPLKDPLRANDQITCIALSPGSDNGLAVGTSFHGFFESTDRGKTWTSLSEQLVPLQLGGGNYEEIASLAYDPEEPDLIWFNLGFGKGLYTYRKGARSVDRVNLPPGPDSSPVRDIYFRRQSVQTGWFLETRTASARWALSHAGGTWKMTEKIREEVALPADKTARLAAAADKYGTYVSSFSAGGNRMPGLLEFIQKQGLNSMVLDFKDDEGYVTYDTALPEPIRIGSVRKRFKIDEIVQTAHARGLYLIGRIVVFRDKQLYNADNFAHAAWDRTAKAPWRYLKKSMDEETGEESFSQGEYWVDPYSEYVWDYNIAIAKELQDKGVDEVQFDYIRFPSDGDLGRITWRFRREGMGKLEALESFLAKARESLSIPLSTDVYGYCGWARISNWVAQNIEMFSRYVDVVQPMFYPSHFPRDFLGSMEYLPRAKYIYQEGTKRSAYMVEGRSIIRPYVQAFRIGGELAFDQRVYSTYLVNQVEGSLQGAGSGFTLWNASNDYYMVTVPLAPIIQGAAGGQTAAGSDGQTAAGSVGAIVARSDQAKGPEGLR